jgi:hypothetical protein
MPFEGARDDPAHPHFTVRSHCLEGPERADRSRGLYLG